jgi:hypothetical protein
MTKSPSHSPSAPLYFRQGIASLNPKPPERTCHNFKNEYPEIEANLTYNENRILKLISYGKIKKLKKRITNKN